MGIASPFYRKKFRPQGHGSSNGRQLALCEGHRGTVYHAAFSPDGARIVTASEDSTARNTARGRQLPLPTAAPAAPGN